MPSQLASRQYVEDKLVQLCTPSGIAVTARYSFVFEVASLQYLNTKTGSSWFNWSMEMALMMTEAWHWLLLL
jgi:hypothetical protein